VAGPLNQVKELAEKKPRPLYGKKKRVFIRRTKLSAMKTPAHWASKGVKMTPDRGTVIKESSNPVKGKLERRNIKLKTLRRPRYPNYTPTQ